MNSTAPDIQAQQHPEDAAFEAYVAAWHKELEANWNGGYAQIPNSVRNDASLSAKAKLVYEQLLSFMWFKTDRCWPSQATLAEGTGYSRRTVIRALKELDERGYIECVRRGLGQTNYYFVNPLSFTHSFRPSAGPRTAIRLPHVNQMTLADPMFLCGIANATKRPVEPYYPEVTDSHNGSDGVAQQEETDCHTNCTKTNLTHLNKDKDSDSSGTAASSENGEGDAKTIRKFPTHIETNTNPPPRNSKPLSVSFEIGGATPVKAEKVSTTSNTPSKWQGIALAHGISLIQLDALDSYIKNCPRPAHIPMLIEQEIDHVSRTFNNVQYLTSNRTHAAKLWQYARLKGMNHETVQDMFREWVHVAATATVPPYIENKMAWFFRALRLEVLKALLPYEYVASVAEEQPSVSETNETPSQEQEEQREGEQETQDVQSINQEQDASPVPTSDEQKCQEQSAPEPECLMTEDPDAGWATSASAAHWADRLRECVGKYDYSVDVLSTRFGRWGFYLYEQGKPEQVWQYMETSMVIARMEEEKKRLN